ncbi:hypothetical protein SLS53_006298 [Cytospora paraplurivora]|uniref:Cell division control protein 14 n=1 Tax=Cytospora paraplurivora TaxID=2898453 RepID=A0AAN9YEY1_9PEZI
MIIPAHCSPPANSKMETLLSVAFDNLASFDGPKVKKGLRQVEGLLAQICLSAHAAAEVAAAAAANKNNNATVSSSPTTSSPKQPQQQQQQSSPRDTAQQRQQPTPPPQQQQQQQSQQLPQQPKQKPKFLLSDLTDDAAFREFFKLQDGFQWNIATRLIQTLDRLLAKSDDGSMDVLMLSALDSLQGVLLLHPPSRLLFSREQSMNLLLDLLEPVNCPAIQSATLLVLVVALVETPRNTRSFENLDGLLTVSSIFKSRSTARDVKFKTMEFLYFYLMPETPSGGGSNGGGGGAEVAVGGKPGEGGTLSQQTKQEMLRRHLPNVDELVKDLQQYAPLGGAGA